MPVTMPRAGRTAARASLCVALHSQEERAAARLARVTFVPGVLQTERYARAVLGATFPPLGDEERDKRLVTRLERARILDDPTTPVFWALLRESLAVMKATAKNHGHDG
ncbi:Scr1 family TA system antitoxin-like transcriptional regulator [Streptomyces viridosporus]